MRVRRRWWTFLLLVCVFFGGATPAYVQSETYLTAFSRYRAIDGGLASWQLNGVTLNNSGELQLAPASASPGTDPYPPGGYHGHSYYNGGSFVVGEATGPINPVDFPYLQAVASWNAATPAGTWVEPQLRALLSDHWTKWYSMGIWAADTSTIQRHSVDQQDDADGTVSVDTLLLNTGASAWQLKLRLFSADSVAVPTVSNAGVTISTTPPVAPTPSPGNPALWNTSIPVPPCSQMIYPNGGENWCSPTSTSMVVGYWANDGSSCDMRVHAAVAGTYDWLYDGNGNWPFNTAYGATHGLEGNVVRFSSMADLEPWIAAGVPVIFSFAWQPGELTGAKIPRSFGHLAVLVGFDAGGNPIVNDPAAASDGDVLTTYQRSELEPLWLKKSGGTVYLLYPPGHPTPYLPAAFLQPVDLPFVAS